MLSQTSSGKNVRDIWAFEQFSCFSIAKYVNACCERPWVVKRLILVLEVLCWPANDSLRWHFSDTLQRCLLIGIRANILITVVADLSSSRIDSDRLNFRFILREQSVCVKDFDYSFSTAFGDAFFWENRACFYHPVLLTLNIRVDSIAITRGHVLIWKINFQCMSIAQMICSPAFIACFLLEFFSWCK
jgi:hypothetical protein